MPFAPVEGGQLHYELDGKEDLPVLVFSNALGLNLSMWDSLVPIFAQQFRVLRYDSYGHGSSTVGIGQYSVDMLAKDVIRVLDHLGMSTVSFCGVSVGGLVGQWLGINESKRISKLVLCNTAGQIGSPEIWNERIKAVKQRGISSISKAVVERWFTEGFQQREPAVVDRFRKILESTPAEGYAATAVALRDADLRGEVSGIRRKTLIISGMHDKSTPPEGGRFLAERILGSRYVELDSAHLSCAELPQRFSEEVLKFLVP